jgi:hypothetical protein
MYEIMRTRKERKDVPEGQKKGFIIHLKLQQGPKPGIEYYHTCGKKLKM